MLLESLTPFICESHLLSGERPHTQSLISPPAFSYTNAAKATSGHTVLDLVYVLVLALFLPNVVTSINPTLFHVPQMFHVCFFIARLESSKFSQDQNSRFPFLSPTLLF